MNAQSMANQQPMHYDVRSMPPSSIEYQPVMVDKSYSNQPPPMPNQPMNVIQRISGIIKSQIAPLHAIMHYIDRKTIEEKLKK